MDDTLQNLENELKRLPARKPSVHFMEELQRELGTVTPALNARPALGLARWRTWSWAAWSLVGAAAGLVIMAVVQPKPAGVVTKAAPEVPLASISPTLAPGVPANRYEPVKATSVLYDLSEEGLTTLPDRSEGRQLRYRFVDTYTWKNPTTNASLRWSVPRDEVRLVRANLD